MEHAVLVRVMHGAGNLHEQAGGFFRRQPTALHPRRECAALDEPHGEVMPAVVMPDFEDGHDVRVLEPRRRLGLGAEALDHPGRSQFASGDNLERDLPTELGLPRAEHDAHAAARDFVEQFVAREAAALEQRFRREQRGDFLALLRHGRQRAGEQTPHAEGVRRGVGERRAAAGAATGVGGGRGSHELRLDGYLNRRGGGVLWESVQYSVCSSAVGGTTVSDY